MHSLLQNRWRVMRRNESLLNGLNISPSASPSHPSRNTPQISYSRPPALICGQPSPVKTKYLNWNPLNNSFISMLYIAKSISYAPERRTSNEIIRLCFAHKTRRKSSPSAPSSPIVASLNRAPVAPHLSPAARDVYFDCESFFKTPVARRSNLSCGS
jgi:hypothetical protein